MDPDSEEKFNTEVFRRLGDLGLLGVTVAPEYGGSGMDASAACIVHEELSAADPAFCLSYLGKYSRGKQLQLLAETGEGRRLAP